MPEVSLTVSERFDVDHAAIVRAELCEHLTVSEPQSMFRKSADSTLASVVQLLGDAAAWLPLSAAATVYLSAIAQRAGAATWDGLASLFRRKDVKPLLDVAKALTKAANAVDGEVKTVVGLNIPDDRFGTALVIAAGNAEELAHAMACFIAHADQLSKEMQAEIEAGRTPLGRAVVELQQDGNLIVRWLTQDLKEQELRISRPNAE